MSGDALTDFIRSNVTRTTEGAEHPSEQREQARQEALQARAENVETWKRWTEGKVNRTGYPGGS